MDEFQAHGEPTVSICIPAHQAAEHLAAAIDSVVAQTWTDWELVVLDNASTDGTGDIARSYTDPRIRVERNRRLLSMPDNWNRVTAMVSGRYLKVLCADDVLAPDCLARQVAVLDDHPEVALVASRRHFVSEQGELILADRGLEGLLGHQDPDAVLDRVVRSGINPIGWPAGTLLRRRHFEQVGGFDDRWLHAVDLDLWLRLLDQGAFYGIDRALAAYRISPRSISATAGGRSREHRRAIRAHLERSGRTARTGATAIGAVRSAFEVVRQWGLWAAANSRWRVLRALPATVTGGRVHEGADRWWHRQGSTAGNGADGTVETDLQGTMGSVRNL